MRIKKVVLLGLLLFLGLFVSFKTLKLARADTIEELNAKIQTYQKQLETLAAQSNTLANQISQFNAQISLTTLKIQQTEEKIKLLGGRIDQLEVSLDSLTAAFSSRAVETYKMNRMEDSVFLLVSSESLDEAISRYHYLQKIQKSDEDLLQRLQRAQTIYKGEKNDQEDLQKELNDEKANLNAQKQAKANLLAATKNDEKKYQQLLSEAKAQLAAFSRFVSTHGGASILNNQTKCDSWGCYYNQRDSQWGTLGIGLSSSSMAEYGCLITSMAMVASHYGKSLKPSDIATSTGVFVGSTAYMIQGSWNAGGVSTTRTRVCTGCSESSLKSQIDAELAAGHPVIVGLYSGPDHFIVIKGGSGGNYIMNDPFLENGGDKPLSDKYSLSNIKTLDIVRVN